MIRELFCIQNNEGIFSIELFSQVPDSIKNAKNNAHAKDTAVITT